MLKFIEDILGITKLKTENERLKRELEQLEFNATRSAMIIDSTNAEIAHYKWQLLVMFGEQDWVTCFIDRLNRKCFDFNGKNRDEYHAAMTAKYGDKYNDLLLKSLGH